MLRRSIDCEARPVVARQTDRLKARLKRPLWLAGILALLVFESRAEATKTFSYPVRNSEGDSLACFAENLTNAQVDVSAVLRDQTGAALNSFSFPVLSGRTFLLANSSTPVSAGYCEFEFDGDPAAVRGFIQLTGSAGTNTRQVYPSAEVRGAARPGVVTYSPPVASGPDDLVACVVQNLDSLPVDVTAQLRNSIDGLVAGMTVQVGAGDVTTIVSAPDPAGSTYCRFAFDGNPVEVRGYVRLSDVMGGNTRFLAAAAEAHSTTADDLHTPAVVATGGAVRCLAQNLGGASVFVDADLLDSDGAEIDASPGAMIAPGHVFYLTNNTEESTEPISCRFSFGVKQHSVQTYLAFTNPSGGGTRILEPAVANGGTAGLGVTSFTAALRNVEGSDLECWVGNLGLTDVDVAAALIDELGAVVDSRQSTIDPGQTRRMLKNTQVVLGAHCRFTFNGSPADVRGFSVLNDGSPRLLENASIALPITPIPTATPTRTFTPTRTVTPTRTATPTLSRTPTRTPTFTGTPTSSPSRTTTATSSVTPANTPSPSATPALSPTLTTSPTRTSTGTSSRTPTSALTSTRTPTPSSSPTKTPTASVSLVNTPTVTGSPPNTATATASTTPTSSLTQPPSPSPTFGTGTETATPVVSPTITPQPGAPGDANCDGPITVADVSTIVDVMASGSPAGCGEDVNGDGHVDDADIDALIALLFGT